MEDKTGLALLVAVIEKMEEEIGGDCGSQTNCSVCWPISALKKVLNDMQELETAWDIVNHG